MTSIRARLASGLAVSLALVLVAIGVGSSLAIRHAVEAYLTTRLDHDAQRLTMALRTLPDGRIRVMPHRIDPVFGREHSGRYYRIQTTASDLRSPSLGNQDLPLPALSAGEAITLRTTGPAEQPLFVRVHAFDGRGPPLVIAVAEDWGPAAEAVRRWQMGFGAITAVGLLLVLALQAWLLARGFRPMARIADELEELGQGDRPRLSTVAPDEARPLVLAINRLLEVLEERLRRSRRAAGDLAHALKTPLAALQGLVEEMPAGDRRRQEMEGRLAVMNGRIARELGRARVMGGAAPGTRFDPERDLKDLVATVRAIYRDRNLDVRTNVNTGTGLAADREDMLELLGNLLDNACKWAREQITVGVESTAPGGLRIVVADDGPGVPEAERPSLLSCGRRLDEDAAGHGLGLAIVQDIVAFYQGQLALDQDPVLGGLRVRVELPRTT
ncbi:sensor histidine kinase [Thioalkalivibrio paradoxus]|uniref:histidine kinase n=1 Tax=Thioalkalivibrio paradoxus ARh 1 TaxID=713585 RepID=W0DM76_9GAMM|nr:sensor histidine kinase [Thioalkalivibrio paradoxus]AHE98362.1 sensor histidine kinase [Thioalkalivibrio paradoxus ARh 1]